MAGCALMTILAEAKEVHPAALVTVQLYVPGGSPVIFELIPVPEKVVPPGFLVKVHVPVAGNPLNMTLPVSTEQEGCEIATTTGTDGVAGCALMTMLDDGCEVHPISFVTV